MKRIARAPVKSKTFVGLAKSIRKKIKQKVLRRKRFLR
jgi:hypothetical protein